MCQIDPIRRALLVGLVAWTAMAQERSAPAWDWRPLGSPVADLALASPVSGPVERVWFSPEGDALLVRTRSGRIFRSTDGERWTSVRAEAPAEAGLLTVVDGYAVRVRAHPRDPLRRYALGAHVYRSDDGGRSWANLTAYRGHSILGEGFRDLAVSPRDPDVLVVANDFGVWRSSDGGLSWVGLNENLPNLPVRRIVSVPEGVRGARIEADGLGVLEWMPGEKQAWRPVRDLASEQEAELRRSFSRVLGAEITRVALSGDSIYAGAADGRLWVSLDGGRSWRPPYLAQGSAAAVEGFWVDPTEPRLALAALGAEAGARVVRTVNGGIFWDDITANLPAGARAHAVAADRAGGVIYVATDYGLFYTRTRLDTPGPATPWRPAGGSLPRAAALDVKLDAEGHQLFVALEGYGLYVTLAPHRRWDPRVVSAADYRARPLAPGALLSVLGVKVDAVRAGESPAPVLAATDQESQIQVPFDIRGARVTLSILVGDRRFAVEMPLAEAAPAIFVDRDGAPLVLDESGVLLDALRPAGSGSRLQLLATGLGAVRPPWPAGLPAPLENPPEVATPVRAFLDGEPIPVTRAILAPGYTGFYLVEVRLPELVNRGPAELYLESGGRRSNAVRLYLEP